MGWSPLGDQVRHGFGVLSLLCSQLCYYPSYLICPLTAQYNHLEWKGYGQHYGTSHVSLRGTPFLSPLLFTCLHGLGAWPFRNLLSSPTRTPFLPPNSQSTLQPSQNIYYLPHCLLLPPALPYIVFCVYLFWLPQDYPWSKELGFLFLSFCSSQCQPFIALRRTLLSDYFGGFLNGAGIDLFHQARICYVARQQLV